MARLETSISADTSQVERLQEAGREAIARAMELTASSLWGESRKVTPIDTGRLRGSIAHHKDDDLTHRISTNVEYAVYVHEGTQRMRGRPFFEWGMERTEPKLQKYIERAVSEVRR